VSRGKSQFRKNAKTLARIREKSSNKCILIVTEGKNTEPNYLKALRKKLGLKAADIEVVHETYTAKSFDSCEAVTKELKEKCPEYTKSENPSAETLNKIPFAVANAQRLRKDSEQSGRTTPATTVDLLVRTMNEATRRDLQLPLQKS